MPTIGQLSELEKRLKEEEWVNTQFNTDNLYEVLKTMTKNQYSYAWALIFNKKPLKLRDLLINLGLKARTTNMKTKEDLLPYNAVIQICPECGKVDVCKDDGHNCFQHLQNEEAQEYYD
jgi:hypothetical protein